MISNMYQRSSDAPEKATDPDVAFRAQFLKLLDCLQVEPTHAVALAEASTGRPFETCTPMHLVPVLDEVLKLLHAQSSALDTRQLEV